MKKRVANKITKCSEMGGITKRTYKVETSNFMDVKLCHKKEPLRYFPYTINQIKKARRIVYKNNKENDKGFYYITEYLLITPWNIDRPSNIEVVGNPSFKEELIDGVFYTVTVK